MRETKDFLEKIAALARDGDAGEKVVAMDKLKTFCEVYGYDVEDFLRPNDRWHVSIFECHKTQEKLLRHIVAHYIRFKDASEFLYRLQLIGEPFGDYSEFKFKGTLAEINMVHIACDVLMDDFNAQMKKSAEVFTDAYIRRQNLFPSFGESKELSEMKDEELEDMFRSQMIATILDAAPDVVPRIE